MTMEYKTSAEFKESARIVSDYKNDMIFEQPRTGLVKQVFTSYEYNESGMKVTETTRVYSSITGYNDTQTISIMPYPGGVTFDSQKQST